MFFDIVKFKLICFNNLNSFKIDFVLVSRSEIIYLTDTQRLYDIKSNLRLFMNRNILLVEPSYKTKFPPLGLMKISSYHKKVGDNVKFIKGINKNIGYECFWDRIYISTMFTFNWDITIRTIQHYKELAQGDLSRIYIGGILASLMPKELWEATGIIPNTGILNKSGALNDDNNLIIDKMIPDYDLFKDSQQEYSLISDSYFGYSTRGCPNKCDFCGVKTLEPQFIDYRGIKTYIKRIIQNYGEKVNLVLFDNNILASKRLDKVVGDLLDLGFEKGAKYSYKNKAGHTFSKLRSVDFNQGIDARLFKEDKVKLLSKLAINPLRIAFDHIKYEDIYSRRIELSAKYGIKHLSNYILYNYDDTPEDLWNRLKININLNKKYGLQIYSFPMKYMPLNAKDRSYIYKPSWNWQFLRGVQRILNVVKGIVMPGEDFFHRAFGENVQEFKEILHMPEQIVMYRQKTPQQDEINWINKFRSMTNNEKQEMLEILNNCNCKKKLTEAISKIHNRKIKEILEYYLSPDYKEKKSSLFN